tara:strand:+ start:46 stop:546 length:501 start_codon:yes stop_codon:yes gene_type:complete
MAITRLGGANAISGSITSSNLPTGSVLQVVRKYTASSAYISTTSTSLTGSGFSQAITPTVVGSLLVIHFNVSMADANGDNSSMPVQMYYKIGSGSFGAMPSSGLYHIGYISHTQNRYAPFSHSSHITTTSTDAYTFEPYFKSNNGNNVRFAHSSCSIGMTIFEVKQ